MNNRARPIYLRRCQGVPHRDHSRGAHRYDSRLTTADSLMRDRPDSALRLLEALPHDSLVTEHDRAYRDLLLTQARYKANVTATSDSAINRAVAYYRAHPKEHEKLTRAYIYKGAVMSELGFSDSAMLYFKQAESVASPDDFFNLGYVNMRMGALYRDLHTMDGKHIEKYETALEYLKKTSDKHYQLVCIINLGSLYCLKYPEKADSLLISALSMSESMRDTLNFIGASQNLVKLYNGKKDFSKARGTSRRVLDMNGTSALPVPFCLYTAFTYAHLHMPDSAQMYIDMVHGSPVSNAIDSLTLFEVKRDIALSRGDSTESMYFERLTKQLDDSLHSLEHSATIVKLEDNIYQKSEQNAKSSKETATRWIGALIGLFSLTMAGYGLEIFRRKRNKKKQQQQISQLEQYVKDARTQIHELELLKENLQRHNIDDETLKELLNAHLRMMIEIVEECYHTNNKSQLQKIRDIVQFQNENKQKWTQLYQYLDMEYNGVISQTRSRYPTLNEKDLLLIAMSTLDFSYIQMAMILGYKDASSMGSAKLRLAKKMGLDGSINEYINRFKSL